MAGPSASSWYDISHRVDIRAFDGDEEIPAGSFHMPIRPRLDELMAGFDWNVDPWDPDTVLLYDSPYQTGDLGEAILVGRTQFHHNQHFTGMGPDMPGATTIVLYDTANRRVELMFRQCIGTRATLPHGFPRALFLARPTMCPYCDSHMCTMRSEQFRSTNVQMELASHQAADVAELPGWKDILVRDRDFFEVKIRPFLTSLPVLRTYQDLGPALPGVHTYIVTRQHSCKELPLFHQHICRIRTLQVRPLVLRYILAAYVVPLTEPNGVYFGEAPWSRVYRAPDPHMYSFVRGYEQLHTHYRVSSPNVPDQVQFANLWARDMIAAKRLMYRHPAHSDPRAHEWTVCISELQANNYEYVCDKILDFLVGDAPRLRSRSSAVHARQVEYRRKRAERGLRARPLGAPFSVRDSYEQRHRNCRFYLPTPNEYLAGYNSYVAHIDGDSTLSTF